LTHNSYDVKNTILVKHASNTQQSTVHQPTTSPTAII